MRDKPLHSTSRGFVLDQVSQTVDPPQMDSMTSVGARDKKSMIISNRNMSNCVIRASSFCKSRLSARSEQSEIPKKRFRRDLRSPPHDRFDRAELLQKIIQAAEILAQVRLLPDILAGNEILLLFLPFGRVVQTARPVIHVLEKILPQSSPTGHSRQLFRPKFIFGFVQSVGKHGLHAKVPLQGFVALQLLLAHVDNPLGQLFHVTPLGKFLLRMIVNSDFRY